MMDRSQSYPSKDLRHALQASRYVRAVTAPEQRSDGRTRLPSPQSSKHFCLQSSSFDEKLRNKKGAKQWYMNKLTRKYTNKDHKDTESTLSDGIVVVDIGHALFLTFSSHF